MSDPWEGDVNTAVVENWTAETTPFDRVKEVLLETTAYQYAKSIAKRARVSEPSARKHLETLAEGGYAETDESGHGTKYKRSRETLAMTRIQELHSELTKDELIEGIRELKERIGTYQEEYDATDPDDLAVELDAGDGAGWTAVSRWRAVDENLKLAQAALSLYDFDPDSERGSTVSDESSRGSFASDSENLSA